MTVAEKLDDYIRMTGQDVFIEVEGKPDKIDAFINQYNFKYSPAISRFVDGIITLQPDANKWGLELRLYLNDKDGLPKGLSITHNDAYRGNYSYRINDIGVIRELFDLGYRIGLN
ncbi:MAG: hypothetical protein MRZ65_09190 [Lachnospiraceae bacterium]|nr:hypothetical protein [Lachnospiraceae bacterium]